MPRGSAAHILLTTAVLACLGLLWPLMASEQRPGRQRAIAQRRGAAQAPLTQPGDHTLTLRHEGRTRTYLVHVPARYDGSTPLPLLVALHGGGGSMTYQANDDLYGLITASERHGFVAVFPNGVSRLRSGALATWNAGACCGRARDENVDDVGFIREVVAHLTRTLNIDRRRVHATGMSNGAMMAYRLACELPEVFAGIAAVAGTDNTGTCRPDRPVSILHVHARDDGHVQFEGGAGPDAVKASFITDFTSVPDTISAWVARNGCVATPRRVLDTPGATCDLYAPCRGATQVQLCVTETGGHSWPGGRKPRGPGTPSQALVANDVMWAFFTPR